MNILVGIVLVLGVMILVHEWGHFIVARLFGVRVDVFSIGFGPRLFGWKRGATDYRVSLLPLGGYVRMAGQEFGEGRTGAPDEFMSKARWQRVAIAFAGPAVNLLMPLPLIAAFVILVGVPSLAFMDHPIEVSAVSAPEGPEGSTLKVGDRILSLNNIANPTWEQALKAVNESTPGATLKFETENQGVRRTFEVSLKDVEQKKRVLGYPPIAPIIDEVFPGTPASRAGLQSDDEVVSVGGRKIGVWGQFVDTVKQSNGQPLAIEVKRKGRKFALDVTPQKGVGEASETVWQVGVQVREVLVYHRGGLVEGARYAGLVTADGIDQVFGIIGKLFSGRVSVRQLQSFVGIARESGQAVRRGPFYVISMMAMISVNLGILNLLPIPILDGGHILLLAIEGSIRRDLSLAFKERYLQVGFVFLLALFAFVMYNDVVRMLPAH